MDIHPPHPIHSWKDFGVQLITITAGILIALSLEGVRESIRDRALVREARENIHREIADNKHEVDNEISAIPARLVGAIGIITANGDPREAPPAELARCREQVVSLRSTLYLEEQMTRTASERYKTALE